MSESFPSVIDKKIESRISNLSPELQAHVRTQEFKDWFGDWEHNPDGASRLVEL